MKNLFTHIGVVAILVAGIAAQGQDPTGYLSARPDDQAAKKCKAKIEQPDTRGLSVRRNGPRGHRQFWIENGECLPGTIPCKFWGIIGLRNRSGLTVTVSPPGTTPDQGGTVVYNGTTAYFQIGTAGNKLEVKCSQDRDNKETYEISKPGGGTDSFVFVCKKCG